MSTSLTKEQAVRQIWLLYFNRTLLERGIITEKQYKQMKVNIQSQPGGHTGIGGHFQSKKRNPYSDH